MKGKRIFRHQPRPDSSFRRSAISEGSNVVFPNFIALRTKLISLFKQSATTFALSVCFIGAVQAASNAAGSIFGSADGDTVVVENIDTGLSREIPVEDGRFNASALPIGNYTVTLRRDGETVATREGVFVRIGSGSEVSFAANATELQAIVVTGSSISPIDVSSTDTRVVFTADQLDKIPVGRSIQEVALLTPGVVEGDPRYLAPGGSGTASFGGSAASENAFYINGYAVTNPLTNLGSTSLPFDSISQFQAITGGYGAEFGRATGGVVNILTKSGTNEFKAGARLIFEPNSLRGEERDIYYPHNGTERDGLLYQERSERQVDSMTFGAYGSGPIVKDKLFFYAAAEIENRDIADFDVFPGDTVSARDLEIEVPRWIVKLDWNITNNHLFDFTAISDVTKRTDSYYDYYYGEGENQPLDPFVRGDVQNGGYYYEDGGDLYIAKYTGYLTNDLTFSALYGMQHQDHIAIPFQYDPSVTFVSDTRPIANPVQAGLYDQLPFPDAYDETSGYRFDIEWRIADHTLRFGYDRQDSESKTGEITSGPTGTRWRYETVGPNPTATEIEGSGGARVPDNETGDYVVRTVYANGGTFNVEQDAFYLEDRWLIENNWLLSLGLRNERFANFNADGIVYAEQDSQWAPRIGATWDVFGDSSLKIFGQIGRYHLAMPLNVAVRGAAGSLFTTEYFQFESIDPATGIPLGLTPLGDGPFSNNNEYGQAPAPETVAAVGLKSHFQDEIVIGFEKLLGDWNVGARWVYRDLKSAIDDTCDGRPAKRWALENGFSSEVAENLGAQLQGCRLFNPGLDNTFRLDDGSGNIVTVPLTAEDLGYPKLKRTYNGIDMFIEYPFDGTWYYKVDYTFSKNYGNAEGQLQSDVGQGDVSQTIDWDHPEMMENKNGYLPNDRRHYIKAFGFYQLTSEWRFSGTMIAHSGRPKNCMGFYANPNRDPDFSPYGTAQSYYGYCGGQPSLRGSRGRLPTTVRLDVGVNYAPDFFDNKLQFGLDVFNLTNRQTAQSIVEYGESGGGEPHPSTNRVISYSTPRLVSFTVQYDF